ncbi:hypothetical protein PMAYCL1PPCAC_04846, partial [Pristionchus mayeri]
LVSIAFFVSAEADVHCADAGKECAVIYKEKGCGSGRFSLKNGANISDLYGFNDEVKSLVVTRHCTMFLYQNESHEGDSRIFTGNLNTEQYYELDKTPLEGATKSETCSCDVSSSTMNESSVEKSASFGINQILVIAFLIIIINSLKYLVVKICKRKQAKPPTRPPPPLPGSNQYWYATFIDHEVLINYVAINFKKLN